MDKYGKKSTFASFLPGIAGKKGIPIWCYYVNRGQAVVSFGVENKDHAIMEFYPAHEAYKNVKRTGFRTFIRVNGEYLEPFSDEDKNQKMNIEMNTLELVEQDLEKQLDTRVMYYVLPEEPVGALVRRVTLTNRSDKAMQIQLIDGMPELIPYGVGEYSMKSMTQTAKAWMQFEKLDIGVNYYRVRASMEDSATVKSVKGGNFAAAFTEDGRLLETVGDCSVIFDYDNSLEKPHVFMDGGLEAVHSRQQRNSNLIPSAFFCLEEKLQAGESLTVNEIIGQVENAKILKAFMGEENNGQYRFNRDFFDNKEGRAEELTEEICRGITTRTGKRDFDKYCKYTYLDNVLRGGYPLKLGHNKIFYIYSRKHGDLERDYNYFSMLPEYYSQGNGNFRDVNQNRRCDTFFAPYVGRDNIYTFFNLIQLDGYNPLGVEKISYSVPEKRADLLLTDLDGQAKAKVKALITKPYTPGRLIGLLEKYMQESQAQARFENIIDFSDSLVNGNFGEGYWCDHWTYNLDLIEEYLSVFPEQEEDMIYERAYTYFKSQAMVLPRFKRYVETDQGIRQYSFLCGQRNTEDKIVKAGETPVRVTLMEKLVLLCCIKTATLDPEGMGVEMEGGKPGWYDALNGLPGLLGSSMAETYELSRLLRYTIDILDKYPRNVELTAEVAELVDLIYVASIQAKDSLDFWNQSNDIKEKYTEKTYQQVSGDTKTFRYENLVKILRNFRQRVNCGIEKAMKYGKGISPTYFSYEVVSYEKVRDDIRPLAFKVNMLPYFLEGPVRSLKLEEELVHKQSLYNNVKASDLYDRKLSMYKVNASLENASYELGRAKAFTAGWLENESIWLHMEYKYLLELLKSGMYREYAGDFYKALIPFQDEKVYGRSILENSSFIASSKNPDKSIHGKGFVARLSGSTIEFISMWRIMMFGQNPFVVENGELCCQFKPLVPEYLLDDNLTVSARFLSDIDVTYHFDKRADYYPGNYRISHIELIYKNNARAKINGQCIRGEIAVAIREKKVSKIDVWF